MSFQEIILNFINDILEINRLESDKVVIEKINFNLSELTENIVTSFKEFIHENNIKCHLDIDKSIDFNLKGDQQNFLKSLINLLNNAIKFSKMVMFGAPSKKQETLKM